MKILHISPECYPAAKAGGLGDVVGALPKYLSKMGCPTGVVIPKYQTKWIKANQFYPIYSSAVRMHNQFIPFTVEKESQDALGFPLFVIDIPGKFDRPGVYLDERGLGYGDEAERSLVFQQAALKWIMNSPGKPQLLHCHDHHTGLIPFFVKYSPEYQSLKDIPTVFTIHNGAYHGAMGWDKMYLLPFFEEGARGLLDWGDTINPLAAAIKSAWRVTTVSPTYLAELMVDSNGMEWLVQHEKHKAQGILNGIDSQVWDPRSDGFIQQTLSSNVDEFKAANKAALSGRFHFDSNLPIITFIGRLANEKGADLIPDLVERVMNSNIPVAILVLGTGDPNLHQRFSYLKNIYPGRFDVALEYNEGLAHQLYAGSDFLFMPSRVEPCGLNQMYAMRYGTVPIVRAVGGLKDTVLDIGEPDGSGRGIQFTHFSLEDAQLAIYRASELYKNDVFFKQTRDKIMGVDFSWERSAASYLDIYNQILQ